MSLRMTEDEYARYLRRGQSARMSEKAWQMAVVRLLKQYGYDFVYHTWDSRRSPSGFPDLIAASTSAGRPLLALELKAEDGIVRQAQAAWLAALAGCQGVVAEVWRPSGLEEICQKLRA